MQIRSRPLLLMMVSSAIAVLPVWRSPMISSRWPRPMGIMESMAFSPVAIGSFTGWRSMTPGARRSSGNVLVGVDRTLVVDGIAQRIDHAADQGIAHRHAHDAAGAFDLVAFFDFGVFAQQHHAHLVFFQVHGDAGDVVREGEQFARHDLVQAINAGDAVANGHHRADFIDGDLGFVVVDLLANELGDLVCFDLRHKFDSSAMPLKLIT